MVNGPDGLQSAAMSAGTCFDFNKTKQHLYLVGGYHACVYSVHTYVRVAVTAVHAAYVCMWEKHILSIQTWSVCTVPGPTVCIQNAVCIYSITICVCT